MARATINKRRSPLVTGSPAFGSGRNRFVISWVGIVGLCGVSHCNSGAYLE